ncbi:hypothetical protein DFH28DRAFT_1087747 [Melampsora americana]|nr:hypothetical protein DFH28DRAFT_1087747 [Melampsora americana]
MSSFKFKPEPKRVVCQCQSFGCYKGVYLDANGVSQYGVEVLPGTKEAHKRADKRSQINSSTASRLDSQQAATSSHTPTTDSQESLAASLDRLLLASQHPTSPRPRTDAINTGPQSTQFHHDQGVSQLRPDLSSSLNTGIKLSTTAGHDATVTGEDKSCVVDAEICTATNVARDKGVPQYNCGRFYSFTLANFNPVCLHVALTAAIMTIFDHSSMSTSAWLLDMMRITIELSVTHGLVVDNSIKHLEIAEISTLKRFPRTITTAIGWLQIDPTLVYMNCCQSCFALYPISRTPISCNHRIASIPGGPPDSGHADTEISSGTAPAESVEALDFSEKTCGNPLLHTSSTICISKSVGLAWPVVLSTSLRDTT